MVQKFLSYFTLLIFACTAALHANIAGVLPLLEKDGEAYALLGKGPGMSRRRPPHHPETYSAFYGRQAPDETLDQTALRGLLSGTGQTSFPTLTLADINRSAFYDHTPGHHFGAHHRHPHHHGAHHHRWGHHLYRQYFVDIRGKDRVSGRPLTIADIETNARAAQQRLGVAPPGAKTGWAFVKVTDLLTSNDHVGNLPLSWHLQRVLEEPRAKQILTDFIASVRARALAATTPTPAVPVIRPVLHPRARLSRLPLTPMMRPVVRPAVVVTRSPVVHPPFVFPRRAIRPFIAVRPSPLLLRPRPVLVRPALARIHPPRMLFRPAPVMFRPHSFGPFLGQRVPFIRPFALRRR